MRKQQSDLQVMKTRIKKSLHRKGPSSQLGKTWVQVHETFNKLNSFSPMCKQNDKTKSVPGGFDLTQLHEAHSRPAAFTCWSDRLVRAGAGVGKAAVQSQGVGRRTLCARHYKVWRKESRN